ncbi:glycosyl hydrolase 53 family protein [candidate division KSB1 bacterium]|nr:glycosyl hydrolase 53 family protein [candidate division KSB1 bacterium]
MSKTRIRHVPGILLLLLLFSVTGTTQFSASDSTEFIKGADVSFIPQIEDLGGVYSNEGVPQDPLTIFKDHGVNYIRLKLWHTPDEDYNNLEKILVMARRIEDQGLKFLLNFHYSDDWADPGKQTKPVAWEGLSFEVLKDSVYQYTKHVIQALNDQGTLPEMVQVGNEITPGMLWPDGRVGGSYDTPQQWQQFGELLKSAILGVRESCAGGDSIQIMIHIDRGGSNSGSRWFFDNLHAENVEYDIIGLSYYPWWHGTLGQLTSNLNDLAARYDKDIIVVETAYPWTLQWYDSQPNIVGSGNDLHAGYPASVLGQSLFLRDLIQIIRNTNNQKGIGLFYWAPEYISVEPLRSPWENCALFGFNGDALNSMDVFLEEPIDIPAVNVTVRLNTATLMDTLQENHYTQIRGEVSGLTVNDLPDGQRVTWEEDSELILENAGGDYWEVTFQMYPGDELSYKFWTGFGFRQGTFQRLGWEGPITPPPGFTGNRRVFVAGEQDTVLNLQYYNSTSDYKDQYWRPFESKEDSTAIYFRVNMGKLMDSGRFDPDVNGPIAVRGDAATSGGQLDWDVSKVILQREEYSVNNESFWAGTCYIANSDVADAIPIQYKFYVENDSEIGWENSIPNRQVYTTGSDTTLHWQYFDESGSTSLVDPENSKLGMSFRLRPNFPNPFNQQTRIQYALENPTFVTLKVYNLQGKLVSVLVQEEQAPGTYSRVWNAEVNGNIIPTGIYFIHLETEYGLQTQKMLFVK